jgi:outer membrane receptor protein involved in Fe transport
MLGTTGAKAQDGYATGTKAEAEEASDSGAEAEEDIVVTATRRGSVTAQDVPIAISAVDPDTLTAKGLGGLQDIARTVPSLNVLQQSPGINKIDMRGLTTGTTATSNIQDRPLVAVYLDDVPMSLQGFSPDIRVYDLERVEIIRGPQGTLYGAGSMAGTIRYITAKPDTSEFFGSAEGQASFTDGGGFNYSLRAIANVPVTPTLAFRFGGYQGRNSGFIDNVGAVNENNTNSDESTQARIAARWKPIDTLIVDASVTLAKLDVGGFNATYRELGDNKYTSLVTEGFEDLLKIYNLSLEHDLGAVTIVSSTSYLDRSFEQVSTFEWVGPLFGLGLIPAQGTVRNDLDDFSQEVRLFSQDDETFNWTFGGFYQKGKRHYFQDVPSPGFDAAFGALIGAPFNSLDYLAFSADDVFSGLQDIDERQIAVFAEGTIQLGKFAATAGVRYFDWRQHFDLFFSGPAGALGPGQPLVFEGAAKADGFNPKFVLSFEPKEDMMIYAQAAKGFRYGGVNQPVATTICADDLAELGLTEGPATFGPDSLWSYEIGSKNQFWNRRATVNVTAFMIDWQDVQTTRNLACGYRFTQNEGRIRSTGLEMEARLRLGRAFNMQASGSLISSKANGAIDNVGALNGDRTPFFPKYTLSISGDYTLPMHSGNLVFSADFQARGRSFTEFRETAPLRRVIPAHEIVNAAVTYRLPDWEIGLFAQNIFNDDAVSLVVPALAGEPGDRHYVGRPRTLGVRLKKSF